jgi:hypothetical protein
VEVGKTIEARISIVILFARNKKMPLGNMFIIPQNSLFVVLLCKIIQWSMNIHQIYQS